MEPCKFKHKDEVWIKKSGSGSYGKKGVVLKVSWSEKKQDWLVMVKKEDGKTGQYLERVLVGYDFLKTTKSNGLLEKSTFKPKYRF